MRCEQNRSQLEEQDKKKYAFSFIGVRQVTIIGAVVTGLILNSAELGCDQLLKQTLNARLACKGCKTNITNDGVKPDVRQVMRLTQMVEVDEILVLRDRSVDVSVVQFCL